MHLRTWITEDASRRMSFALSMSEVCMLRFYQLELLVSAETDRRFALLPTASCCLLCLLIRALAAVREGSIYFLQFDTVKYCIHCHYYFKLHFKTADFQ